MKLLLFSDLHCDASAAQALVERAREVDVVVGAGDFATARRGIGTTVEVLKSIACPAVLVPGNGESCEELAAACRGWSAAHVLHGSGATIDGVQFYGLGGGVPVTPFGSWSYDFTEAEAAALLADCPADCVLVSHSPPHGALDRSSAGVALGSRALRAVVEQTRPALVVCGHVHEWAGQSVQLGSTPVVNGGSRGLVWDLATGAPNRG
ncbi:MAG: serine/threonine protein phosphatase [Planctomycetes bacterium RBG_16_64_10]|nr:MAG: serine/threonine protein phosphatase [Planctomycetes bacterium RBG_16_64_10]